MGNQTGRCNTCFERIGHHSRGKGPLIRRRLREVECHTVEDDQNVSSGQEPGKSMYGDPSGTDGGVSDTVASPASSFSSRGSRRRPSVNLAAAQRQHNAKSLTMNSTDFSDQEEEDDEEDDHMTESTKVVLQSKLAGLRKVLTQRVKLVSASSFLSSNVTLRVNRSGYMIEWVSGWKKASGKKLGSFPIQSVQGVTVGSKNPRNLEIVSAGAKGVSTYTFQFNSPSQLKEWENGLEALQKVLCMA